MPVAHIFALVHLQHPAIFSPLKQVFDSILIDDGSLLYAVTFIILSQGAELRSHVSTSSVTENCAEFTIWCSHSHSTVIGRLAGDTTFTGILVRHSHTVGTTSTETHVTLCTPDVSVPRISWLENIPAGGKKGAVPRRAAATPAFHSACMSFFMSVSGTCLSAPCSTGTLTPSFSSISSTSSPISALSRPSFFSCVCI